MTRDHSHLEIFTEIGFGNTYFVSTEIEKGRHEKRIRGFVRFKFKGIYFRIWIGHRVVVFSIRKGFSTQRKPKKKFKVLLGLYGQGRK